MFGVQMRDIEEPWLAARIVSMSLPTSNLRNIQSWTDRNLLGWDEDRVKTGKNQPRLYSFKDLLLLKSMDYLTTLAGLQVNLALGLSKMVYEEFFSNNYDAETNELKRKEQPQTLVFMNSPNTKVFKNRLLTNEEMIYNLERTGNEFGELYGRVEDLSFIYKFPIDMFVKTVWDNYKKIPPELNQMALEGRFKPGHLTLDEIYQKIEDGSFNVVTNEGIKK